MHPWEADRYPWSDLRSGARQGDAVNIAEALEALRAARTEDAARAACGRSTGRPPSSSDVAVAAMLRAQVDQRTGGPQRCARHERRIQLHDALSLLPAAPQDSFALR
jgi:hypothetical protein